MLSHPWLGCLRLLQMLAIPCKNNELRIRVTTRFGWRRDQKTKCWMKKSCMVSSWNLLMEGEYFGIMSSIFCVNPSALLVFRSQSRYQTILCSPCDKKLDNQSRKQQLWLCVLLLRYFFAEFCTKILIKIFQDFYELLVTQSDVYYGQKHVSRSCEARDIINQHPCSFSVLNTVPVLNSLQI